MERAAANPPRKARSILAFAEELSKTLNPEVIANTEVVIAVLAEFGTVEEVELPSFPWDEAASTVVIAEAASAFEDFVIDGQSAELTASESGGLYHGLTIPAVDYLRALRIRRIGGKAMDGLLERFDAIVAPTYPNVASPIHQLFSTYFDREHRHNLGGVGNLCGLPSISVPSGFGERGLPTGLQFLLAGRTTSIVFSPPPELSKREPTGIQSIHRNDPSSIFRVQTPTGSW